MVFTLAVAGLLCTGCVTTSRTVFETPAEGTPDGTVAKPRKAPAPKPARGSTRRAPGAPSTGRPEGREAARESGRERVHVVRPGETMFRIARGYGLGADALAEYNGIADPTRIFVGQRLRIPPSADVAGADGVVEARPPEGGIVEDAAGARRKLDLPGRGDRPAAVEGVPAGGWKWPIEGAVASRFGARGHDGWHSGLDLTAPEGTPVRAARAGTVSFAGKQGRYGRLVIVDHGDGTTTWYAHLEADSVHAGENVSQGEVIGRSGRSGNATGPHLHFEIRFEGTPVDPLPFLDGDD